MLKISSKNGSSRLGWDCIVSLSLTRTSFFLVVSTLAWKVAVFVPLLGRVVFDGEGPALAAVVPEAVVLFAALVLIPLVLVSGFDEVVFCGD